jgi:hypothetical protein
MENKVEEEIQRIRRKREGEKADGKKRLDDEEHIGALFYTYRPHSTEVAAGNYERKRNDGRRREEKSKGSQSEPVVL